MIKPYMIINIGKKFKWILIFYGLKPEHFLNSGRNNSCGRIMFNVHGTIYQIILKFKWIKINMLFPGSRSIGTVAKYY